MLLLVIAATSISASANSVSYSWGVNRVNNTTGSSHISSSRLTDSLYTQHTSYAYYGKTLNTRAASKSNSTDGFALATTVHPTGYKIVEIDALHRYAGTTAYTNEQY